MTTITEQIAALDSATTDDLIKQFLRLHKKAPRTRNRPWLIKRVVWAIQAEAFGGLSKAATKRLDLLIGQIDGPLGAGGRAVSAALPRMPKPNAPAVGTTLTRQWRGQQVVVHVRDNGYEHDGVLYRSLSAVASAITQSHWSGALFFGLRNRKKAS